MTRTAKRSMFLVFTLFFLFGMTPPQLHAADWTKVKMTSENIQQLAGLKFAGEFHRTPQKAGETKIYPPPRLSISGDGKTARFLARGDGNTRPYNFKSQIGVSDGMLMIGFWRGIRLFTVERNGAGKFRIQTKWGRHGRSTDNYYTYTLVFDQE